MKRWRRIARSEYEATARSLFKQLSYRCPADTLFRLRRGSEVLIKSPGPVSGCGGCHFSVERTAVPSATRGLGGLTDD